MNWTTAASSSNSGDVRRTLRHTPHYRSCSRLRDAVLNDLNRNTMTLREILQRLCRARRSVKTSHRLEHPGTFLGVGPYLPTDAIGPFKVRLAGPFCIGHFFITHHACRLCQTQAQRSADWSKVRTQDHQMGAASPSRESAAPEVVDTTPPRARQLSSDRSHMTPIRSTMSLGNVYR
jgi:hypothetical protein